MINKYTSVVIIIVVAASISEKKNQYRFSHVIGLPLRRVPYSTQIWRREL